MSKSSTGAVFLAKTGQAPRQIKGFIIKPCGNPSCDADPMSAASTVARKRQHVAAIGLAAVLLLCRRTHIMTESK